MFFCCWWAQILAPGVKRCPQLCLWIQLIFSAHDLACNRIFSCLYLSDVVPRWPQIKDSNRLCCCAPQWRVINAKYDGVPRAPLGLVQRLHNFPSCHHLWLFKHNKRIHFYHHLAEKVTLANLYIFIYLLTEEATWVDLRWNEWTLTVAKSSIYL